MLCTSYSKSQYLLPQDRNRRKSFFDWYINKRNDKQEFFTINCGQMKQYSQDTEH